MKKQNDIPLSAYAERKISERRQINYKFSKLVAQVGFATALFAFAFIGVFGSESKKLQGLVKVVVIFSPWIIATILYIIALLINHLLRRNIYAKEKAEIIAQNEVDYWQSLKLNEAIKKFSVTKSTDFPVVEQPIGEKWKPFRIEHFMSNSLRQSITAKFDGYGGGIFGGPITGSIQGNAKGISIPNLLDSSSVLFLKNKTETLRVLIPSPRATKELFVQALEHWLKNLPKDSHTQNALKSFSMDDSNLLDSISHPQFIDSLDSNCELSIDQRPDVTVRGILVQGGVALITSIETKEKQEIFLPSGFFSAVTRKISEIADQRISEPNIVKTVKKEDS